MPSFENQTALRDVPDVVRRFKEDADPAQLNELLVFARCLFVRGEHGFAEATGHDVAAFLQPAIGLELYDTRRRMFERLRAMVPNPAYDVPPQPGNPASHRHTAKALRVEVHRRTADKLGKLTQADALRTERRSMPFYAAMRAVFGRPTPDTSHYAPIVERVGAFLVTRPAARALDIACGYGLLIKELAVRAPETMFVGTDILSMPGRIVGLGHQQPFRSAAFDAVTATSLLEHVVDPDALVREMARLVKPDGLVGAVTTTVHTLFLNRNPLSYVEGLLSTVSPGILPPHHHLYEPLSPLTLPHRAYTRQQMQALFLKYFREVEVSTIHFLHLKKFGLDGLAPSLPGLKHFGGQLVIFARGPMA
jgi:2-polyprenyl-3-methyl-5-hydroxy-6-metoxy-1,4-benzoquinol methylase